jgi:hypothetical protein
MLALIQAAPLLALGSDAGVWEKERVERERQRERVASLEKGKKWSLKGLSHEIDFKNFDNNLKYLV